MVNFMKEFYKEKLPQWYNDTTEYGLTLTDDIDSLLGCAILKAVKGWDIEQIMLFKANKGKEDGIYKDYLGVVENATHEAIGVDFAMVQGKCFDNHLCKFSWSDEMNPQAVNINNICGITRANYWKKYNLSTVLLLWSLYDLPKENLSDELMMVLIAIDGSFEGFYTKEHFKAIHKKYMVDILDLPEFYACEERHTYRDFKNIQRKYKLSEKIKSKKGMLSTDINIEGINDLLAWECDVQVELPTEQFYRKAVFKDIACEIKGSPSSIKSICENPFSYALTKKNFVNYSERIEF